MDSTPPHNDEEAQTPSNNSNESPSNKTVQFDQESDPTLKTIPGIEPQLSHSTISPVTIALIGGFFAIIAALIGAIATIVASNSVSVVELRTPVSTNVTAPTLIVTNTSSVVPTDTPTSTATPTLTYTPDATSNAVEIDELIFRREFDVVSESMGETYLSEGEISIYAPLQLRVNEISALRVEIEVDVEFLRFEREMPNFRPQPGQTVIHTPTPVPLLQTDIIDVYEMMGVGLRGLDINRFEIQSETQQLKPIISNTTAWEWRIRPTTDAVGLRELQLYVYTSLEDANVPIFELYQLTLQIQISEDDPIISVNSTETPSSLFSLLYEDPDSFTILLNDLNDMTDISLQSDRNALRTIVDDFPILSALNNLGQAGMCFRYIRSGTTSPLPDNCDPNNTFERELSGVDVFWRDNATNRFLDIVVRRNEDLLRVCPAATVICDVLSTQMPNEVETEVSGRPATTVANTSLITLTPTPTNTPTLTPTLTLTPTNTPTNTLIPTVTSIVTHTSTSTLTETLTRIPTNTSMLTPTNTAPLNSTPIATLFTEQISQWTPESYYFGLHELRLIPARCVVLILNGSEREICFEQFFMDRYEVTNALYRQCVEAGACVIPGSQFYDNADLLNTPVVGVTFEMARTYCEWALEDGYVPSAVQWEYATRGVDNRIYPWGNTFEGNNLVHSANSTRPQDIGSRSLDTTWVGLEDMAGNVSEWTSTIFSETPTVFLTSGEDIRSSLELTNTSSTFFVVKGGSWSDDQNAIEQSIVERNNVRGDRQQNNIGFRCASDS